MFGRTKVPVLKVPKSLAPDDHAHSAPNIASNSAVATMPPPSASTSAASANLAAARANDRNDEFYELKTRIYKKLVETLDLVSLSKRTGDDVREEVKQVIAGLCEQQEALLNFNERQRLISEILDETFGLGPLETLLKDPAISDILINGPKQVYIERKGRLSLTGVSFRDNAHLMHV